MISINIIKKHQFLLVFFVAGVLGFEPRMVGPEPTALPLGYTPKCELLNLPAAGRLRIMN